MKTIVGFFSILISLSLFSSQLEPHFLINGERDQEIIAKEKSNFSFYFKNESRGMNHKMFMKMHAKPMHTIVIKDDYSHIAHIHPYLDMKTGIFSLDINTNHIPDFDNQSVRNTIPDAGRYFVFTEVMPMGLGNEAPMIKSRYEVTATGQFKEPVQYDYQDGSQGITLYFDQGANQSQSGAKYKVIFSYEQFDFCDKWLPKFYFEWFEKNEEGTYSRAENFEKWLEMGGHSILIDTEQTILSEKIFYHLHAFLPMSTMGEFVFPYHDHKRELPAGNYKIFGQFKRENKVFTVPVPFKYTLPVIQNKCK
tara:strand:- start:220708 stop:221631 length:924 start_codon:yes stop_codon:yes gene_type:complete